MSRDFTTDELLNSIKRRCGLPVHMSRWSAARMLGLADEIMRDSIVPLVREAREHHFTDSEDISITSAQTYDIPEEALNRGISNAALLNDNSDPLPMTRVNFDRELHSVYRWGWSGLSLQSRCARARFDIRGDKLWLFPRDHGLSGETVRLYFERMPNRLCLSASYTKTSETNEAAKVVSVDTGTGVVTCTTGTVPSGWGNGTELCVVKGVPGFTLRVASTTASAADADTVTLPTADVADIAAGDWVAPVGDSPIVQLPSEVFSILAQQTGVHILAAQEDPSANTQAQILQGMKMEYRKTYTGRVDEQPQRFGSRNRLVDHIRR